MFGLGGILPMIVILGALGSSVVWYYNSTQATIQQLRENNLMLEKANETNQETIAQLEETAELNRKLNEELQGKYNEAAGKVNALRDKLIDHDLTNLSMKKPALIEKRINNGTAKVFDHLRVITTDVRVQSIADDGADSDNGDKATDDKD